MLQYAVARSVPVSVRDWVVSREVTGGVDWAQTRGIALRSDVHSFVRFNIAGRERDGILVEGSDAHRIYKDWVVKNFLALKEQGTDAPIVKDVLPAHELFPGARCELLPDLIVRWAHRRRATKIYSDQLGEITAEPETGRTGEHRPNGFAVVLDQNGSTDRLPLLSHRSERRRLGALDRSKSGFEPRLQVLSSPRKLIALLAPTRSVWRGQCGHRWLLFLSTLRSHPW